MLLIKAITVIVLLMIFAQDLRSRAVYWVLFPILFACLLAVRLSHDNIENISGTTLVNAAFLTAQLLLVTGYFCLKSRRFVNITRGMLGWGDILFLSAITVYFSVGFYFLFYVFSLMLALGSWLFWRAIISTSRINYIPLAGLQAAALSVLLITVWWHNADLLTSDYWLFHFFKL